MIDQTEATVNTSIKSSLVSEADKAVLAMFGYKFRERDYQNIYFFMPESKSCFLDEKQADDLVKTLLDSYPNSASPASRPQWVTDVLLGIEEKKAEWKDKFSYGLPRGFKFKFPLDSAVTPDRIFQGMLRKPENSGKDRLDMIEIMGCYRSGSSNMAAYSTGGWVTIITPQSILSESTQSIADKLRQSILNNQTKRSNGFGLERSI